ncbi:MAG: HAD hydrolase-like protein, partial [bacterium]|nr:HAD hydrolase-like protein [bacterium]
MNPSEKKVCVFDFDGTIVDSMDRFADVAAGIIERVYDLPWKEARGAYLKTSGLCFRDQLEVLYPGDPVNDHTAEEFEEKKKEGYLEQKLIPHLTETLHHLRGKGVKIVVSSNNKQELVEQFLETRGIEFDLVLGWRPNFSKGEAHFNFIQNSLNISSNGILFVGDSLKDAELAHKNEVD